PPVEGGDKVDYGVVFESIIYFFNRPGNEENAVKHEDTGYSSSREESLVLQLPLQKVIKLKRGNFITIASMHKSEIHRQQDYF
ncbi:MAG TPA: hypothetical protein VIY47_16155, partial [Ignavibacteriaceae bacterium]